MQAYIDPKKIPFKVQAIASALKESGGRPYIVGGSVRDVLLEKPPADWDVAVDLDPEEVLKVFPGACTVGIEFGRVSVGDVDVVSLRAEKGYEDKRHPNQVTFGVSLEKDLERRDFTVNGMAWDPWSGEIFDPCGGLKDLKRRQLVCIGNPLERLEEDPLRILRAIRLKNSLGFNLDASLVKAILGAKGLLSKVAGERVFAELKGILLSLSVYQGLMDLHHYGLDSLLLPELKGVPCASAQALSFCCPDLRARLAILVGVNGLCGGEFSDETTFLGQRFHLPSKLVEDTAWLASNCDPHCLLNDEALPKVHEGLGKERFTWAEDPGYVARKIAYHWGQSQLERLVEVKRAVWLGLKRRESPRGYLYLAAGLWKLARSGNFMNLALGGNDVMELLGINEGHLVGQAIQHLREAVLRDPNTNQKEALSRILLKWWDEQI